MTYYLIWRSNILQSNLKAFNALNNLRDLPLSPLLQQWALRFQLNYPNDTGTEQWAYPLICNNSGSSYFNAVAMPVFDAVYESLNSDLISELQQLGVLLPDEGITQPVVELPADWNTP